MGARAIDIDSVGGWANFAFAEPKPIDRAAIADTMDSASYGLTTLTIVVPGRVVADGSRKRFEIAGTGQRFTLAGGPEPGFEGELRAELRADGTLVAE